jgi:hypothetical protein
MSDSFFKIMLERIFISKFNLSIVIKRDIEALLVGGNCVLSILVSSIIIRYK